MNFTALDWTIVGAYLAASVSVGLLGKRYVGKLSHYLVAGRELGLYVGIATLAATEIGTITFMYNAELGYKYGFASFAAAMISGLVMIFVGRTGFVIRRFRELKLMTVPEYFEIKYSRGLRIVTGILVALGGILNMGVFLKIEGEFLTIVRNSPSIFKKTPIFRMPPKATRMPVTMRNPRLYLISKYSGTVINFNSRKRRTTKPVRPTKIMTRPEIIAAAKEAKPYL